MKWIHTENEEVKLSLCETRTQWKVLTKGWELCFNQNTPRNALTSSHPLALLREGYSSTK